MNSEIFKIPKNTEISDGSLTRLRIEFIHKTSQKINIGTAERIKINKIRFLKFGVF